MGFYRTTSIFPSHPNRDTSENTITARMAYSSGMAGVLIGLAIVAFWLYSLFDVITTPEEEVRNVPKTLWVIIVVLIPLLGSVFWLLFGRPSAERDGTGIGHPADQKTAQPPAAPPRGPDDDPEFLRDLERRMRDDD